MTTGTRHTIGSAGHDGGTSPPVVDPWDILEALPDMCFVVTRHGHVARANDRAFRLLGKDIQNSEFSEIPRSRQPECFSDFVWYMLYRRDASGVRDDHCDRKRRNDCRGTLLFTVSARPILAGGRLSDPRAGYFREEEARVSTSCVFQM